MNRTRTLLRAEPSARPRRMRCSRDLWRRQTGCHRQHDTSHRFLHWRQKQLVARTTREIGPKAPPPAQPRPKSKTRAACAGYWRNGKTDVVDDTWTTPREAGVMVSPYWRRRGQARLSEAVPQRVERFAAQSQSHSGPGSRAQRQRPRLHHRQALRKSCS